MTSWKPCAQLSTTQRSYLIFIVVTIFVLAQIVWWTVFQRNYVRKVSAKQAMYWEMSERLMNDTLAQDANHVTALLERYPDLIWHDNRLIIDPIVREKFRAQQQSYLRMFTYEAPFFALVVLIGLGIMLMQLGRERQLQRQQQNFLNAVSHEFKTPISTLKLLIQSAQRPHISTEKKDSYIMKMAQELSRLELTSGQVLAAARLERSEEDPVLAEHEWNTVVRNILQRLQAGLEARGADIQVAYTHHPLPVSLDVDAFTVVLSNILDNAVKYTPQTPKKIHLSFSEDKHLIHLHVDDEGVGISDEEARRIFHRFYRVGDEMTRQSKGVGLGLYLVKHITESMRGWVTVSARNAQAEQLHAKNLEAGKLEATKSSGSRFSITLPRRVTVPYCSKMKAQYTPSRLQHHEAVRQQQR